MGFFAILIALLLEQARPLAYDNVVHALLRGWSRTVRRNLDAGESSHGWVAWSLAVGVPALTVALVHWGLWWFSSVLAFVWMVAVLYVTLGFRQFSHHFSEIRNALEEGNDALAREKLAEWLRVDASSLPRSELLRQVIEHSVLSAHRHVFGVLVCFVVFWALGLGPAGAVFYRSAEYLSRNWRARPDGTPSVALQHAAAKAWARWALRWWATSRKPWPAGAATPSVLRRAATAWCWQRPRARSMCASHRNPIHRSCPKRAIPAAGPSLSWRTWAAWWGWYGVPWCCGCCCSRSSRSRASEPPQYLPQYLRLSDSSANNSRYSR